LFAKPGVDYDLGNLENFVINIAGGATRAYIEIVGLYAYLNAIYSKDYENPKYTNLIAKYKQKDYEPIHEVLQRPETKKLLYALDEMLGKLHD